MDESTARNDVRGHCYEYRAGVLVCLSISFHGGKGKHITVHSGRCSNNDPRGLPC